MTTPGQINVLLVHPYADTAKFVATLLAFESDIHLVGTAASGEEARRKISETNPQIVLLASELPDVESTKLIFEIATRPKAPAVIVISTNENPEFLRRCMQAGARFYLVMPFTTEQLVTSIRTVCTRLETERAARARSTASLGGTGAPTGPLRPPTGGLGGSSPKLIAFFAPKGGVGKTTIAVNTAVGLRHRTGARVALVDADLSFGDLHLLLNLRPDHTIIDFVDHIGEADADYVRSVMTRHESGVRVLPSPISPEHAELIRAEHVKPLVSFLRRSFEYIVVDCAVSYDDRTLAFLDAADVIVVITAPEVGVLHNTVRFLELSRALGYPREKLQLVLNRADSEVGITPEDIEASLGQPLRFRIPSRGTQFALAANVGQPFIMQNGPSDASKAIFQLVDFLAGKAPVPA